MRIVKWTDEQGYNRVSWVRDDDPDNLAPQGIPCEVPVAKLVDWERVKRDVHNQLVERGILSWDDVQRQQDAVTATVRGVVRRAVLQTLRESNSKDTNGGQ